MEDTFIRFSWAHISSLTYRRDFLIWVSLDSRTGCPEKSWMLLPKGTGGLGSLETWSNIIWEDVCWNYTIFKGSLQTKPFCDCTIQFYTLQKQETKQWSSLQQGLEFSPSGEKRGSHLITCFLLHLRERCWPSHGSHVVKQLLCMENTALGVNGTTGGLQGMAVSTDTEMSPTLELFSLQYCRVQIAGAEVSPMSAPQSNHGMMDGMGLRLCQWCTYHSLEELSWTDCSDSILLSKWTGWRTESQKAFLKGLTAHFPSSLDPRIFKCNRSTSNLPASYLKGPGARTSTTLAFPEDTFLRSK